MAMAPTMNVKHSRNNEWACRLGTIHKSMISDPVVLLKSLLSVAIMALDGDVGHDAIVPFWFEACQSWPWPQQ